MGAASGGIRLGRLNRFTKTSRDSSPYPDIQI